MRRVLQAAGPTQCPAYLQIRIFNDTVIHSFIKTASCLFFVPGTVLIPVDKEGSWSVSQR